MPAQDKETARLEALSDGRSSIPLGNPIRCFEHYGCVGESPL